MTDPAVLLAAAVLFALATGLGIFPVRKIVQMNEARHELRRGSAGWIRTLSGWIVIAVWVLGTWYFATIIGDWAVTRDLGGAIDRSLVRLYVLMEILAALAESN